VSTEILSIILMDEKMAAAQRFSHIRSV